MGLSFCRFKTGEWDFENGDLEGVVLIATSGARVSAAGGESEEEKPGEAESLGSTAGGVRGVVG